MYNVATANYSKAEFTSTGNVKYYTKAKPPEYGPFSQTAVFAWNGGFLIVYFDWSPPISLENDARDIYKVAYMSVQKPPFMRKANSNTEYRDSS